MKRLFAIVICAAALAACGEKPTPTANDPAPAAQPHENHAHEDHSSGEMQNQPKEDHAKHGDRPEFRWDHLTAPKPDHELVDLKNAKDPVSLLPVGTVTAEYKGYLVHFESDATKTKFERKPIKFLNMLSLEPHPDGSVTLVEASNYQDAVTEFCPFMPESEVDPHGTVYLLHRGWKIFFCCWTGCGDYFMQDPPAAYGYYGLVERDGKLVKK